MSTTPLKDTYSTIYKTHRRYDMCGRVRDGLTAALKRFPPAACCEYLDVGCGRGESLRMARDAGYTSIGLEIVPALCIPYNMILIPEHDAVFPIRDEHIALVTCLDVLEHIPETDVGHTVRELWRVTRDVAVLSIPSNPSSKRWTGTDLHLTQRNSLWWTPHLKRWCPGATVTLWKKLSTPICAWYVLQRAQDEKETDDEAPGATEG